MNLFDKKTTQTSSRTTQGFYFGISESEGESSYKDSENPMFYDYLDILPRIAEGSFIITGRKGVGKSAIAKYIKDNATAENCAFCDIVKSDTIKLEKHIQSDAIGSDEMVVLFFRWLILVKLIRLILESKNGNYTPELKAINSFIKNNGNYIQVYTDTHKK
jgi:zona occludens toxin (predicted ATPase)